MAKNHVTKFKPNGAGEFRSFEKIFINYAMIWYIFYRIMKKYFLVFVAAQSIQTKQKTQTYEKYR